MGWLDDFVLQAHRDLDESIRESLWCRGLSDSQIDLFQVGYIGDSLPPLNIPSEFRDWSHSGAKLVNSYVLPLTNPLGEVLGVQFRSVDREVKGYQDYFLTRAEPVLLGLSQAMPYIWESETICIVEGGFDMFPVQRVLPYTVPSLTSKVSDNLARWLHRLVRRVILFYDADSVGVRASADFTKMYGSDFDIQPILYPRGVTLPTGKTVKDPADLWEAWGDDQLSSYLRTQISE